MAAGWHSNAWENVRGTDMNAYVNLQGLEVDEWITQIAEGATNTIPAIKLPYFFGRQERVTLSDPQYEYLPARATNNIEFGSTFFAFLE